ncbi:MAG TPA: chemotaxis protein CheB [Puia sp.]|nr:chemotaxis protein CheB [Puia sp.]
MSLRTNKYDHYIVAIGASAGGLEAIHEFFDSMPDTSNLSFILIQHLSPDYKSLLVELVSRHTHMQVYEAEDNQNIERKCIYVIPNTKLITIQKNQLKLSEKKNGKTPNNAVDVFLYSLARERKDKAISVIMSGTGTDGTKGTEAIKKEGGLVIVQDPATAKFDGMPNSVIATGNADFVLPPSAICEEILNHIAPPTAYLYGSDKKDDQFLKTVFDLVQQESGMEFHYYKTPTILRRITRRMMQGNFATPDKYVAYLKEHKDETRQLGQDFLIGVTRFFRDSEAFTMLREKVLRPIIDNKEEGEVIKVWVTACSTGEEAYSIAILINEMLDDNPKRLVVKIFATDVDEEAILFASVGEYPLSIEKDIDESLLQKYFIRRAKSYTILPTIRKQIVFARHNIIKDPPFIKNDLVSCRNMLIYISPALQQRIFSLLLFSAGKEGYLFLGPSENSALMKKDVMEIDARWKIYQKTGETKPGYYSHSGNGIGDHTADAPRSRGKLRDTRSQSFLWEDFKQVLTDELHYVVLYIDVNFEIRETIGNYARFLDMPRKQLRLNLLQMLPSNVSHLLSAEIRKAGKAERKGHLRNVRYKKGEEIITLEIFIRPGGNKPGDPYTMIVIRESGQPERAANGIHESNGHSDEYVYALEAELNETKNHLQLAIEDLETANEELQSTNEELLSANEELQSSNEELQSVNEELITLNTEHQLKIKELREVNDDLNNYFRSTDIAQVFLDNELHIRKFNPASVRMINFIETDIGRPLTHISNNIKSENLLPDVNTVIQRGYPMEKEVHLHNGKNLLMRIMPYLTHESKLDGAVISFVDITAITDLNNIIRAVYNSSPSAIFAFHAVRDIQMQVTDFIVISANHAAAELVNRAGEELKGASLQKDLTPLISNGLMEKYMEVVAGGRNYHQAVFVQDGKKWYEVTIVRMQDGFVASFTDISERKLAEEKLRTNYMELINTRETLKRLNAELESKVLERTRALSQSEERFRLVSRATNDALWDWDFVNNIVWWGESFYVQFGYDRSNHLLDRGFWAEKIHPEDRTQIEDSIYAAINGHHTQWSREYRFLKKNGDYAYVLDRGYILHNEYGTPYRMLGSMLDITERKKAEQEIARAKQLLEVKVAERTLQLQQLNEALETSNHDLQQFASIASHDLQEPLRKIHMFTRMILDGHEEGLNEETKGYFRKIVRSTERMRFLVIDILNFSRLTAEKFYFRRTDMNKFMYDILEDFEVTIREKEADIIVPDMPELDIMPGQFRQALHNLLSNALKFTRPGVPPVIRFDAVRLTEKSFDSPAAPDGPYCMLSITDNGIGFEEQFAGTIFKLFQRLHSKDKFEGTGIGLAITKKVIERHDGMIRVRSKEGEGTRFDILIPVYHL